MPRKTVLICQGLLYNKPGKWSHVLESAGFAIRYPVPGGRMLSEAELIANLHGICATIASGEPYTRNVFAIAPDLRVISRTGVGYDAIDVMEATRRGISVCVTPGTNHEAVAEHAFALLLAIVKDVIGNQMQLAAGGFARKTTRSLRGKTLGLVGMGRIGRAMQTRASAFGMRVLASDPCLARGDCRADVTVVPLAALLAESDIVSLHAPLTAETRLMINAHSIAAMKDSAILINTARGAFIDESALAAALHSGKIAAAGLDVFEREPPVGSLLLTAPNVVLSPHIAGVDERAIEDMATMAAESIVETFAGCPPVDRIVNPK